MNRICPAKYNSTNYVATDAGFQRPCTLKAIRGYFRGSSGSARWLQIHDALTLPDEGVAPLRSFLLTDSFDITREFGEQGLPLSNGLVLCVSTTQATKTISTDTADWMPEVEEFEDLPPGLSTAGDLTTASATLQVWADADGPKQLVKVEIKNNHATDTAFAQVHCYDNPNTNKIISAPQAIAAGKVLSLSFGRGFSPLKVISETEVKGCTVAMSSAKGTYTAWGANDFTIKAWYFLLLLLLALALPACAGPQPFPPASQAEVDAGVQRNKFVSPLTLANTPIYSQTNGPTAAQTTNIAKAKVNTWDQDVNANTKSLTNVTDIKGLDTYAIHGQYGQAEFAGGNLTWDRFGNLTAAGSLSTPTVTAQGINLTNFLNFYSTNGVLMGYWNEISSHHAKFWTQVATNGSLDVGLLTASHGELWDTVIHSGTFSGLGDGLTNSVGLPVAFPGNTSWLPAIQVVVIDSPDPNYNRVYTGNSLYDAGEPEYSNGGVMFIYTGTNWELFDNDLGIYYATNSTSGIYDHNFVLVSDGVTPLNVSFDGLGGNPPNGIDRDYVQTYGITVVGDVTATNISGATITATTEIVGKGQNVTNVITVGAVADGHIIVGGTTYYPHDTAGVLSWTTTP